MNVCCSLELRRDKIGSHRWLLSAMAKEKQEVVAKKGEWSRYKTRGRMGSEGAQSSISRFWLSFFTIGGTRYSCPCVLCNRILIFLQLIWMIFSVICKKSGLHDDRVFRITLCFDCDSQYGRKTYRDVVFCFCFCGRIRKNNRHLFMLWISPPCSEKVDRPWVSWLRESLNYRAERKIT